MPFSFLLGLGHSDLYFLKCSSPQLAMTLIFQYLSICQFENNGVFFPIELCLRAYFTCVLKATHTGNSGLGKSPNYLFFPSESSVSFPFSFSSIYLTLVPSKTHIRLACNFYLFIIISFHMKAKSRSPATCTMGSNTMLHRQALFRII